jgi:tetratricopeptide (TPR) repeat protein
MKIPKQARSQRKIRSWPFLVTGTLVLAAAFAPSSPTAFASPAAVGLGVLSPSLEGLSLESDLGDSSAEGGKLERSLSLIAEIDRLSALEPMSGGISVEAAANETEAEFLETVAQAGKPARRRAAPKKKTKGTTSSSRPGVRRRSAVDPRVAAVLREEERGRAAVRRNDYYEASKIFFGLLDKEKNPQRLIQIRFILGRTLQELKLHQVSAFPYYEIIRSEGKTNPKNRYVRQALERLTVAGDALESDVLLNYAVKQITEEDFPASNRDMLYFRRGEVRYNDGNFIEAARELNRVRSNSSFYNRARYQLALSLAEANQLEKAESVFGQLAETASDAGVTNKSRVNAMMGRARILYQRKMFADAIDAYREIPRDTEQWHDALFESTWALLQDGRFRSALSNFHSLHSPFYDDFYQPESLLLRAIVYHYICRYDEMETTLSLFERVYGPVQRELRATLTSTSPSSAISLYREVRRIDESFADIKRSDKRVRQSKYTLQVPFLVARQVLREGDVRRAMSYIRNLEAERKLIAQAPPTWRDSRVGRYAKRVDDRRLEATQVAAGRLIRHHLERIQSDLAGHFEQSGLIRLDMLSGKKEAVKKEIAGKGIVRDQVDDKQDRSFFIQNGYDYWPFKGEFWLDEIGNYHYLGVKACE